jgi:hypothetical protein
MKKLLGLAVLVSVVCLVVPSAARAEVTSNVKVPFVMDVLVPCANGGAGETVHLEGTLHVVISLTVNDNHASGKAHFQPQGVSGVGSVTGDKYQATGVTQESFEDNLLNGQATHTFINNFRVIGKGPGNNFLVHQNVHITFNADGILTADVDNSSVECK